MISIYETEDVVFENLIFFKREVIDPYVIKKEIDSLILSLKKVGINHRNSVISKVIQTNSTKKTITIQICIPVKVNDNLGDFLHDNPQYEFFSFFIIRKGVKIVISNNEHDFRLGIKKLMKLRPELDMSNNPIIELSRISFDGRVLEFELFYED